jgi:hypothetical protein
MMRGRLVLPVPLQPVGATFAAVKLQVHAVSSGVRDGCEIVSVSEAKGSENGHAQHAEAEPPRLPVTAAASVNAAADLSTTRRSNPAGMAATPATRLYQPNAVPRLDSPAKSATTARSAPSPSPANSPYPSVTSHRPSGPSTCPYSAKATANDSQLATSTPPRPSLSAILPPSVEVVALAKFSSAHSNSTSTIVAPCSCPSSRMKVSDTRARVNKPNTAR